MCVWGGCFQAAWLFSSGSLQHAEPTCSQTPYPLSVHSPSGMGVTIMNNTHEPHCTTAEAGLEFLQGLCQTLKVPPLEMIK